MPNSDFIQKLWELGPTMVEHTPHGKKLGIKFVAVDKGRATMSLPYNPDLIGNPDTVSYTHLTLPTILLV